MTVLVQTLSDFLEAFTTLPHHLAVLYLLGVAAALLIGIPVVRHSYFLRHPAQDDAAPSSSMLGLAVHEDVPLPPSEPIALGPVLVVSSKVTPMQEKTAATCTHCGVSMAAPKDFCPACGYAQPMRQSFTA